MRIPWWRRALAPVGVFATIVVTVSVVLMIEQEQRDLLPGATPVPALAPAAPVPILPEGARPMEEEIARAAAAPKQAERQPVPAKPGVPPVAAPQFVPPAQDAAPSGIADKQLRERRAEPAPAAAGAGATEKKALSTERPAASSSPEAVVAPAPRRPRLLPLNSIATSRQPEKLEAVKAPAEWIEEIRRLRRDGQEPRRRRNWRPSGASILPTSCRTI